MRPALPDDEQDDLTYDDLTYDALTYDALTSDALDVASAESQAPGASSQALTGLVILLLAVLGVPAVWADLQSEAVGLEVVFFPVLAAAFGYLAVSRR